jgi:oligoribonuclease
MSIVWCDLETTGLEPKTGSILEIAIVVTDDELNETLEPIVSIAKPIHMRGYEVMDDYVKKMHTTSGLMAKLYKAPEETLSGTAFALRDDLPRLGDVERRVIDELFMCGGDREAYAKTLKGTPLAGSSIHFDRAWLHEHMDDLDKLFSHRMIDVSSFTECAKRWAPEIYAKRPGLGPDGKPVPQHRALDDIRMSIETLRYYRKSGFIGGVA